MKKRNASVDIFRYVCALLVVSTHARLFEDVDEKMCYLFAEIIMRIAVPFFYCVAGCFYFQRIQMGWKSCASYLKRVLSTYGLWSLVYYGVSFIGTDKSPMEYLRYMIVSFVTSGSMYHFWFFPSLIFAVLLCTLLRNKQKMMLCISLVLYGIGCICTSYELIAEQIPVLSAFVLHPQFRVMLRMFCIGFPFFASGYAVSFLKTKIKKKNTIWFLFCAIALYAAEMFMIHRVPFKKDDIVICFSLYFLTLAIILVLFAYPMYEKESAGKKFCAMANFTYYAHPLFLIILSVLSVPPTLTWFIACTITSVFGLLAYKLVNKYQMKWLRLLFL